MTKQPTSIIISEDSERRRCRMLTIHSSGWKYDMVAPPEMQSRVSQSLSVGIFILDTRHHLAIRLEYKIATDDGKAVKASVDTTVVFELPTSHRVVRFDNKGLQAEVVDQESVVDAVHEVLAMLQGMHVAQCPAGYEPLNITKYPLSDIDWKVSIRAKAAKKASRPKKSKGE